MPDTLLDLFSYPEFPHQGAREALVNILEAPHCLGASTEEQRKSSQAMVQPMDPVISSVKEDAIPAREEQHEGYLKASRFSFESKYFIQSKPWDDPQPPMQATASCKEVREWMQREAAEGGFCMNLAGHVLRVRGSPDYEACERDDRYMQVFMHAKDPVSKDMCNVMCKNTLFHFMRRLLVNANNAAGAAAAAAAAQCCIKRYQTSQDKNADVCFNLLFMADHFIAIKFTCSKLAIIGDCGISRLGMCRGCVIMRVGFMEYNYFNSVHAAGLARGLENLQEDAPWEIITSGGESEFRATTLEEVVKEIVRRCCPETADPDGVD